MPTYMTYNQILRDQTKDYLATINPAYAPSPDEIESEILHKVASYIDAANAVSGSTQKLRPPKALSPAQIAEIMARLYPIRRIRAVGENAGEDNDIIAVYCDQGENAGIYVNNDTTLFSIDFIFSPAGIIIGRVTPEHKIIICDFWSGRYIGHFGLNYNSV